MWSRYGVEKMIGLNIFIVGPFDLKSVQVYSTSGYYSKRNVKKKNLIMQEKKRHCNISTRLIYATSPSRGQISALAMTDLAGEQIEALERRSVDERRGGCCSGCIKSLTGRHSFST